MLAHVSRVADPSLSFVCLSPDFCTHAFRVRVIKCMVQCPLLCKEFVIDAWQIYYARSKGADAVLLIAAVLPDIDITYFLRVCKSLGMAALVEVNYLLPTLSPFVLSFFLFLRTFFTVN
jgi:indole-3-glycerol phosphate synthase